MYVVEGSCVALSEGEPVPLKEGDPEGEVRRLSVSRGYHSAMRLESYHELPANMSAGRQEIQGVNVVGTALH